MKSLRTGDLDEANARKWAVIADFKATIRKALKGPIEESNATSFRQVIQTARQAGDPDLAHTFETLAEEHAYELQKRIGVEKASSWYKAAIAEGKLLNELLAEWLSESDYTEGTKSQHRAAYAELRAHLGGDRVPADVSDLTAVRYVDKIIKADWAHETKTRKVSSLSAFWGWMGRKLHVPRNVNPWRGHRIPKRATTAKQQAKPTKRAYTDAELLMVLSAEQLRGKLAELVLVATFLGARLEEICALKKADVVRDGEKVLWVSVTDAKTVAGIRTIAVTHAVPLAILSRRLKQGTSEWLYGELTPGGYDKKRSWHVSKRYGEFKTALGFDHSLDFHSLRRTSITRMENLGLDFVRVARYVGHEVGTLMHNVYSEGMDRKTNLEVARKIRYEKPLEDAARSLLARIMEAPIPDGPKPRGRPARQAQLVK